jgi:hypothetical protein
VQDKVSPQLDGSAQHGLHTVASKNQQSLAEYGCRTVIQVASTHTAAPWARAMTAHAVMSVTMAMGLEGVSKCTSSGPLPEPGWP